MPRIDLIETTLLDIPTIRGHVLSMTTMTAQSMVLARVRFADGSEGLGEGTSIGGLSYGGESAESIKLAIDGYIAPALIGHDGNDINGAISIIEHTVRGNPIARCAVDRHARGDPRRRRGAASLAGGLTQQRRGCLGGSFRSDLPQLQAASLARSATSG